MHPGGVAAGLRVLDCFAGTGTTGVAAVQHGRNSALIELSDAHADNIRKRLGGRLSEAVARTVTATSNNKEPK